MILVLLIYFSFCAEFQKPSRRIMVISSVILLLISTTVTCRPSTQKSNKLQSIGFQKAYDDLIEDNRIENCNQDPDLNELCQRCEKASESKGDDVFAMCCSNQEGAKDYCRDYVYYGVTHAAWPDNIPEGLSPKALFDIYLMDDKKVDKINKLWYLQ